MRNKTKLQQVRLRPRSEYPAPFPGSPSPYTLALADLSGAASDPELRPADVTVPYTYRRGLQSLQEAWLAVQGFTFGTAAFSRAMLFGDALAGFPCVATHGLPPALALIQPSARRAARIAPDLVAPLVPLAFAADGTPVVVAEAV